jgi:hypothetical protein
MFDFNGKKSVGKKYPTNETTRCPSCASDGQHGACRFHVPYSGEVGEDSERISDHTEILRLRLPTLVLNALSGWRGWRVWRGCFSSYIYPKDISGYLKGLRGVK